MGINDRKALAVNKQTIPKELLQQDYGKDLFLLGCAHLLESVDEPAKAYSELVNGAGD